MHTLTIHKVYGLGGLAAKWNVWDGERLLTLSGPKLEKWVDSVAPCAIRATAVHACDAILATLAQRGCEIFYVPWVKTGIAKNAEVEEKVKAYHALPASIFYRFNRRPDLQELRQLVDVRDGVMDNRKRSQACHDAMVRQMGNAEIGKAALADDQADIDAGRREYEGPLLKELTKAAKRVPECQIFVNVADLKDGWVSAAAIMAHSGGLERLHGVSALWKLSGLDVVDGHAPRRKRGQTQGWNPRLRTAWWQLADSIIKNRANRWREVYERFRAAEFAAHDLKHPGCEHKDGHCTARAKRKMSKEIAKEFFLAVRQVFDETQVPVADRQEKVSRGHNMPENHFPIAPHRPARQGTHEDQLECASR